MSRTGSARRDRARTRRERPGGAIRTARAYDEPAPGGGKRFLVDRLWPRGLSKERAKLEGWVKDVAPSDELRRWFGHEPERWEEFRRRYHDELDAHPESWQELLDAARKGSITLVFGAKDLERNNAGALKQYLERRL